jgi:predicted MPP superfamily phosphohydrolase
MLPALPRLKSNTTHDLEEGLFYKVLVSLDLIEMIPWLLAIGLAAILDAVAAMIAGGPVVTTVIVGQLADGVILRRLARKGISFGPLKIQWLMLAVARAVVASIVSLLVRVFSGQAAALPGELLIGAAFQFAGIVLVLRGFYVEPRHLGIGFIELEVPALPPDRELRLLHVADVHVERFGVREHALVDLGKDARPDAILFTGDFLNLSYVRDALALQDARTLWAALSGIAPVFAVSGSPSVDAHEVVGQILHGLPVRWLRDEVDHMSICSARVSVVGVSCTHDPVADGGTLRRVMAQQMESGGDEKPFTILLHHSPDLAPQAAGLGVIDLHLAGHTHGGQVRLPVYGALVTSSLYLKALEMGLYQLRDMLLFVNRGVGLEGAGAPRVRVNCRPEVKLFILRGPVQDIP